MEIRRKNVHKEVVKKKFHVKRSEDKAVKIYKGNFLPIQKLVYVTPLATAAETDRCGMLILLLAITTLKL